MKIELKKISDLKPAPYNPRTSTKKQEEHLKASLEKFGVVEPIIFNERSGYIVGGHFRVRELKKLGYKEVECVIVDLNEDDEKELNIRLNANTGSFDFDRLANEWDEIKLNDWGLEVPTFDLDDEKENIEKAEENNMIAITLTDEEKELWLKAKESVGKKKDKDAFIEILNNRL